jgi:hypothetical protein
MTLGWLLAIIGMLTLAGLGLRLWLRRRRTIWAARAATEVEDELPGVLRTLEQHEQALLDRQTPATPTPPPICDPFLRETITLLPLLTRCEAQLEAILLNAELYERARSEREANDPPHDNATTARYDALLRERAATLISQIRSYESARRATATAS